MSSFKLNEHLNDEQFAECLDGNPLPIELQAHLRECESCHFELKRFETSMAELSAAAWDWSESQPHISLRAKAAATRTTRMVRPLQWAVAALLLIGIVVPAFRLSEHRHHQTDSVATEQTGDSEAQITEDNAMLQSVDQILGAADASPIQEYGISLETNARASHRAARAQ